MAGNASFGAAREEYEPGDYIAQVKDVEATEADDLKNPGKMKPVFIFSVDVAVDGEWQDRKIFTSRRFTDMKNVKSPQFVSGLNKLVKACGMPVPQTADAAAAWDENDLIGKQFIWRVEVDEETDEKVRKYVRLQPVASEGNGNSKKAAAVTTPPPAREKAKAGVAVSDDDDDPFDGQ